MNSISLHLDIWWLTGFERLSVNVNFGSVSARPLSYRPREVPLRQLLLFLEYFTVCLRGALRSPVSPSTWRNRRGTTGARIEDLKPQS